MEKIIQYVIYNDNMFHTPEIRGKVINNLYLADNVWLKVPAQKVFKASRFLVVDMYPLHLPPIWHNSLRLLNCSGFFGLSAVHGSNHTVVGSLKSLDGKALHIDWRTIPLKYFS